MTRRTSFTLAFLLGIAGLITTITLLHLPARHPLAAQIGQTAYQCIQGQCSGYGPPVGACSAATPIYTDLSQTPPAQYACGNGAWMPVNAAYTAATPVTLASLGGMPLTGPVPWSIITGAPSIPTTTSQLANTSGYLSNLAAVTGTITVPTTLLSLGTTVTPIPNTSVTAGTFYACSFNTTNTTAQASLDLQGNAMANGTLNIILRNASTTTLAGGYTINFKCNPQ